LGRKRHDMEVDVERAPRRAEKRTDGEKRRTRSRRREEEE